MTPSTRPLCDNEGMRAEWSAECGADDPVLVVPWSGPDGSPGFIDLRENPYDLDHIPEAEQHPALLQALRALNATRSPVFTAKCDAWTIDQDELKALRFELDLTETEAPHGFASYLDLLWRDRAIFVSFPQQEQRVQRLARIVDTLAQPYAAIECVLRPAMVDANGRFQEGFAVSLYVKALRHGCGSRLRQLGHHAGHRHDRSARPRVRRRVIHPWRIYNGHRCAHAGE